ncbi:MAG: hypothetical protein WC708_00780 [Lentisphaeria bacterium]|jgi:hypothetical protein
MTPSRLAIVLRQIATRIDNSKSPRRDLVSCELKRVLAAVETPKKAYRIITDEPVAVTVGFVPEGTEFDEYDLISDDGGEFVFIDDENNMSISKDGHNINQDPEWPEPDLLIFRSKEEFDEWMTENN